MILADTESLRRKLDFLLLMHTEGSGKLNISMQLVPTSLDLSSIEHFHECVWYMKVLMKDDDSTIGIALVGLLHVRVNITYRMPVFVGKVRGKTSGCLIKRFCRHQRYSDSTTAT